jgi:hypothetical protein
MEVQLPARERVLASRSMDSPPQNKEDRCVGQILDEVAPQRSLKRVLVNRPWTVFLIRVLFVSLVVGLALYWK